jgi:hypothetical protein
MRDWEDDTNDMGPILEAFSPFRDMDSYDYVHSGASIAEICQKTAKMASENPEVEHKTYIVSFPARIVTVVEAKNGCTACFDKGYVEKRKKVG